MEITRAEFKMLDGLLRATGRTIQKSAVILPPRERAAFSAGYLLCRAADTVADAAELAPERKIFWVKEFPSLIDADVGQFAAEILPCVKNNGEKELVKNLPAVVSVYNKFESADKKLIRAVAQKVCEGMLFDLQTFKTGVLTSLKTAAELENYCALMGGAPGVFWSELILSSAKIKMPADDFKSLGENIGDALQIVNILRDVREDIKNGRCYFPESDLKFFNASAEDFKNGNFNAVSPVIKKWILWGLDKIETAPKYFEQIPKTAWRLRLSVLLPVVWSLDTFALMAQTNPLAERVKITKNNIYGAILKSPKHLLSNQNFASAVRRKTEQIKSLLAEV